MKEKLKNLICGIIVIVPIIVPAALLLVVPSIFDFNHIVYWIVMLLLIVGSSFIFALHEAGKEHLEQNPTGKIAKFFNKK